MKRCNFEKILSKFRQKRFYEINHCKLDHFSNVNYIFGQSRKDLAYKKCLSKFIFKKSFNRLTSNLKNEKNHFTAKRTVLIGCVQQYLQKIGVIFF